MRVGKPEHSENRGPPALEGRQRQPLPRCPLSADCCGSALGWWFPREGSSLRCCLSLGAALWKWNGLQRPCAAWLPFPCSLGCLPPVLLGGTSGAWWPGAVPLGLPGSHLLGLQTRVLGAQGTIVGGGGWEDSGLGLDRGLGTTWPSRGSWDRLALETRDHMALMGSTNLALPHWSFPPAAPVFFNLASLLFIPLLKQGPRVLLPCSRHPSSERCWLSYRCHVS